MSTRKLGVDIDIDIDIGALLGLIIFRAFVLNPTDFQKPQDGSVES